MEEPFGFGGKIAWRPTQDYIENANLTRFMRVHHISSFDELLQRSTSNPAWFTQAVLSFLDIQFFKPYTQILDTSRGNAWSQWCLGGELNIVHNCLDKYIGTPQAELPAVIYESEEGFTCTLTYEELYLQVNKVANALRGLGLGKGDVIGLFMPMTPEIVIALCAIARIGGVILPLFSGYGASAVASRLADAEAKALFTADGFFRRGTTVSIKPIADEAVAPLPDLKHVIVLKRADLDVDMVAGRDYWWHELVASQPGHAPIEITSAEETLMIIYTSGTTGRPKGAVHTHCGFPVKAAQDMAFGTDIHPGQVIYWITDMGWMMGPWLVFGALLLKGTLLIYDGAPDYPSPDRQWELVERHRVSVLGLSPTFIRSQVRYGEQTILKHNLSSLRCFASTGEPWNPDPWIWLFEKVGQGKLPIVNYSGGTEISGGIVMGNPILPVKPCGFSAPCPGIAADVFDEDGRSVHNQVGELVIKAPWIGMTRGFWKDAERYEETYWSRWKDTWVHGDFAAVDSDGQWYILGRSDDTIKIAGKRVGPAEVESVLVNHPQVMEAAAIGAPDEIKGNQLIVFCVLVKGCQECDDLRHELRQMVVDALGKPMMPQAILFVDDLPKTRNAKVMRRMIRAAYLGLDPGDTSSLVNPETLKEIREAR
jgi:acetyl-CoA synthetase